MRTSLAVLALALSSCAKEPAPPEMKSPPVVERPPTPKPPPPAKRPDEMTAPAEYRVKFSTSKGDFIVKVTRDDAAKGADRFYTMVKSGFLDECRFFRVVSDFMVQFGVNGDPRVSTVWENSEITDDPVKRSNVRGALTFAMRGPDSRTTQLFINLKDNKRLDGMKFAPFGTVTEGMEVVDALHAGYGDGPPSGSGPNQNLIKAKGNDYLNQDFKKLDFIKTARIID